MSIRKGGQIIAGAPRETGGVEIGDVGIAPFGIDETLNLRRYLNGQIISQSQFASFTNKVKAAVALHPSLSTTETNWQSEKNLSKLGQCGKFVVDDTAGTIRLPCVVNAQGLTDLALIGAIKSESLPNITGNISGIRNVYNTETTVSGAFSKTAHQNDITGNNTTQTAYDLSFNASRSSSTYQDNAPVQQEAVQYPYYIQVATGVEETLPAIREYKVNNSDFFGKSMYSDVVPDNASWLVSNGQWNAKSVYPDYYDWLLEQYNNPTESNVAKVGSVTDNNGVLSGFAAGSYALLPETFDPSTNSWELVFKVKTPSSYGTPTWILGSGNTSGADKQYITFGMNASGQVAVYLSSNGSTWDIASNISGTTILPTNTDYYFKLEYTGSAYIMSISTDGNQWATEATITSSLPIYVPSVTYQVGGSFYNTTNDQYWKGTIDLNVSYININGQRWWNGRKAMVIKTGETSIYHAYDWVVNTADETFRLPLLNGEENIPDYSKASALSNTGTITINKKGWVNYTCIRTNQIGSVTISGVVYESGSSATNDRGSMMIPVNRGDTVTRGPGGSDTSYFIPAKGNGNPYYYVGDTVQDASLINAGAALGQLSDKISRTATSDREMVVGWGMPDYTAKYSAVNNKMYTLDYNCIVSISSDNAYLNVYDKNGTKVYTGASANQYPQVNQYIVPVGYSFECTLNGTIIPLNT